MINRAASGHRAEDRSSLCVWERIWTDLRRIWNQRFSLAGGHLKHLSTCSRLAIQDISPWEQPARCLKKSWKPLKCHHRTCSRLLLPLVWIRRGRHRAYSHGRCARRKSLLSRRNMKARLTFARENGDKDQHFCNNVLWTEGSKIELLGQNRGHVRRKLNTVFQEQKPLAAVKQEVEGSRFGDALLQQDLACSPSQRVLEDRVRPSVKKWTDWLKTKKWSPNPIAVFWVGRTPLKHLMATWKRTEANGHISQKTQLLVAAVKSLPHQEITKEEEEEEKIRPFAAGSAPAASPWARMGQSRRESFVSAVMKSKKWLVLLFTVSLSPIRLIPTRSSRWAKLHLDLEKSSLALKVISSPQKPSSLSFSKALHMVQE